MVRIKARSTVEALVSPSEKNAVVGLGYVGLRLAVHLSRCVDVGGYDYQYSRIVELKAGNDRTLEISDEEMAAAA
jgi:UDP-N-acetyl-D-galactosamine dehydrogenase